MHSDKNQKGSRDTEHAAAHSKHEKPMAKNGQPISTFNVPGVSRSHGTPGWASGPAKVAARRAK